MEKKPLRKKILFVLKSTMAAVLVGLLVAKVDWQKIWDEVRSASLPFLAGALVLYVAGLFMCIERWWRAAQYKKFRMSFRSATEFYFAGLFLNNFLPSFFGGDAYQSYILGKTEQRYAAAISTVMFTRFIGLWATIALYLVVGTLGFRQIFSQPLFAGFAAALVAFLVFDAALISLYAHPRFRGLLERIPGKLKRFFGEVGGYAKWSFLRENFILSVVFALVGVGFFNLMLFYALGVHVPVLPYLAVVFLISLVSSLPVSINNIGLKEWAYYTFFPLIGVRPEAALAVALLGRFLQVAVSLAGAPAFFREKREYDIG
ncbi:MAG: flippase-like domain-containing protein [Candidatus Moranbacteria bacterium]|nr:flippase-like domain-containing protein [Candidatus Moranbacteria bacterium]NTW45560.1 flippase-like domain-containing protein [Candidatus Moranbacteria bacterium]